MQLHKQVCPNRYNLNTIPLISPISGDAARPRWSVMIPVFNCTKYLKVALLTVLAQDIGETEMEIVVVDDCSTDDNVEKVVRDYGQGRVLYVKQHKNVGSLRNFETCLQMARGEFVHLLHGDDFINPRFYRKMESLFNRFPEADVACARYSYVDSKGFESIYSELQRNEDGILENWLFRLAIKQRIQYSSIAVKRKVYEVLGGFYGVPYGEDWEMWVRIAAKYKFSYTPEVLACYRLHENSITERSLRTGENIANIKWVINTIQNHLPKDVRDALKLQALRVFSTSTLYGALILAFRQRKYRVAWHQLHGVVRFHLDLIVCVNTFRRLVAALTRKYIKLK